MSNFRGSPSGKLLSALNLQNTTVVNSLSDLEPLISGGVARLADGQRYWPNGTIDVEDVKILMGRGTHIIGRSFTGDGFRRSRSPSGALINIEPGSDNLELRNLHLETSGGSDTLFDIDSDNNVFMDSIDGEGNIGQIGAQVCNISNASFIGFDSGLNVVNPSVGVSAAFLIQTSSFRQPAASVLNCLDLQQTSQGRVRIIATDFSVSAGGTGINGLAGSANIGASGLGTIQACFFAGGPNKLGANLSRNDIRWIHDNNSGIPSTLYYGTYSMRLNGIATPDPGIGVWTKVAGVTVAGAQNRFTHSQNRLTCIEPVLKTYKIDTVFRAISNINNTDAEFGISINGAAPTFAWPVEISSVRETLPICFYEEADLSDTDYCELWVSNINNADVTVSTLKVNAHPIATGG